MYNLPHFKNKTAKWLKIPLLGLGMALIVVVAAVTMGGSQVENQVGSFFRAIGNDVFPLVSQQEKPAPAESAPLSYEQTIIDAVKKASPSVVSIVISKNLPVYNTIYANPFGDFPDFGFGVPFDVQVPEYVQKGTQKQDVGAGSGF